MAARDVEDLRGRDQVMCWYDEHGRNSRRARNRNGQKLNSLLDQSSRSFVTCAKLVRSRQHYSQTARKHDCKLVRMYFFLNERTCVDEA